MPKTVIEKVLHESLRLNAYKIHISNETNDAGRYARDEFANFILNVVITVTIFYGE